MGFFVSFMRTVVPLLVGLVLGVAAWAGLDLDGELVAAEVTVAVTALYYVVFRGLEEWAERLGAGWLRRVAGLALGWARPPDYSPPEEARITLRVDGAEAERAVQAALDRAYLAAQHRVRDR